MDWEDLRYFLEVRRAGQLARAAGRLGVDATTVGRRLRRLESAIGDRLFEQTREGQTLTEAGERLAIQAEAMEQAAAAIDSNAAGGRRVSGLLRVSASEGFGSWVLASHLPRFSRDHPMIAIDLVANSGFLNPTRREADVAILLARPRTGPLVTRKLADYTLGLYAAQSYLAAHGAIAAREQLRDHPLIGYIPDLLYTPELKYLGEILPALEPRLRSSSINAQYRLAAAGAGVAVLPAFMGDADADLVRILPEIRVTRSFWLVTHRDTHQLARVRLFVEWVVALAAEKRERLLS